MTALLKKKIKEETSQIGEVKKIKKINLAKLKFKKGYVLILLLLMVSAVGIYYYMQYLNTKNELLRFKQNPQAAATLDLIKDVQEHVELPANETPTILTITDADKLKGQTVFSRVQNGDKILVYKNQNRTIIYRPLTDKVIETLPIGVGDIEQYTNPEGQQNLNKELKNINGSSETTESSTLMFDEPVSVIVLNGTRTPGLASSVRNELETKFEKSNIKTIDVGDTYNSYEKTLVVPNTEKGVLASQVIAEYVKGEIQEELSGEPGYDTDITIIIGADYGNK